MTNMVALRHQTTRALAIVPEHKVEEFLQAGYVEVGQGNDPAPEHKQPKRSRKKKVNKDATDADGSMFES